MSVDNSRYIYYHGPMFIFSKYICYVYWMFIGEYIYQGTTCYWITCYWITCYWITNTCHYMKMF